MISDPTIEIDPIDSLQAKVEFLSQPSLYPDTKKVKSIETHMSWVFLSKRLVYKLKKPIQCYFLDFTTLALREKFCREEYSVNQRLGGEVYLGVVPLVKKNGALQLGGEGQVIDWLVKMKRLPEKKMLDNVIRDGTIKNELVQKVAEFLTDFYIESTRDSISPQQYRQDMIQDIEWMSTQLSSSNFSLSQNLIVGITTNLIHYIIREADSIDRRIIEGRVVDAHGDLRPEHIFLSEEPVIIDRIEFNKKYRIMDVAEELSYLGLECEQLGAPSTGQLFLNVYKWKSNDRVQDSLIAFYKAKRAMLKALLCFLHLNEQQFLPEAGKWRSLGHRYLRAADTYCRVLQNK